jgi:hypothetical protein
MSDSVLEHFYRRHYPTESRKQMVLVVDDDAMLRELLARVLVEEGFAVLTAEDGEQALAIASTLDGRLGLVVTDIRMPGMDGLELATTSPASSLHLPHCLSPASALTGISPVPCSPSHSGRLPSSSRLVACFPASSITSSLSWREARSGSRSRRARPRRRSTCQQMPLRPGCRVGMFVLSTR